MAKRPTGRANGRPPDAPELRLLKGNPQKRAMEAPIDTPKPDGIPPYPRQLRAAGKRAWDLYWTYGKVWLAHTDIPTITELCQLHDEEAILRARIEKEGWTEQTAYPRMLQPGVTAMENILLECAGWVDPKDVPEDQAERTYDNADAEVRAAIALSKMRSLAAVLGDTKSKPHPMLTMVHAIRQRMLPLWIEAHLTPSSRGRAKVSAPTTDALDEWEKAQ